MEASGKLERLFSRSTDTALYRHAASITGKKKTMTSDRRLSDSTVTAIMHVSLEKVNIAEWLLTLPDAEYQRCSHAHIAAGTSATDNGRTMSINVETIAMRSSCSTM